MRWQTAVRVTWVVGRRVVGINVQQDEFQFDPRSFRSHGSLRLDAGTFVIWDVHMNGWTSDMSVSYWWSSEFRLERRR